jgi:hypothetical protein
MSVAIVSTSIHAHPAAYELWAKQGHLVVAGDQNAPSSLQYFIKDLGGTYLTPEHQTSWSFSDSIGWKCIQRRNAAVMHAYREGFDYVATVDDDNQPVDDDFIERHVAHLNGSLPNDVRLLIGDKDWTDIGCMCVPEIRQRGTPWGMIQANYTVSTGHLPKVVASQAQVLGDPDCCAVTRITKNPQVSGVVHNVVVGADQYAAFNSQATVWAGRWAPLIACLPHVGRYDDIFASFIAKRIMMAHGVSFFAGAPFVWQLRNAHNFDKDLSEEIFGMDNTVPLVARMNKLQLPESLPKSYAQIANALEEILPERTHQFMLKWAQEWLKLEAK